MISIAYYFFYCLYINIILLLFKNLFFYVKYSKNEKIAKTFKQKNILFKNKK